MLLSKSLEMTAQLRRAAAAGRIDPSVATTLSAGIAEVLARAAALRAARDRLMTRAVERDGRDITPCSRLAWCQCYTIDDSKIRLWYNIGQDTHVVAEPLPA
jgi:hypothetical protein